MGTLDLDHVKVILGPRTSCVSGMHVGTLTLNMYRSFWAHSGHLSQNHLLTFIRLCFFSLQVLPTGDTS